MSKKNRGWRNQRRQSGGNDGRPARAAAAVSDSAGNQLSTTPAAAAPARAVDAAIVYPAPATKPISGASDSQEFAADDFQAIPTQEQLAAINAAIDAIAKQAATPVGSSTDLPLKVAPFIVRELGINLYTSLARVLVEFVANSWDADANEVDIYFNESQIRQGMEKLKKAGVIERAKRALAKLDDKGEATSATTIAGAASSAPANPPSQNEGLEEPKEPTLDESIKIIVKDQGQGMTMDELRDKFLFVGRRRREHQETHTNDNRVVMGRKGIGKLAGFGVAHKVTVVTKSAMSEKALRIEMLYEDIIAAKDTTDIKIPAVPVAWTESYPTGTTVILSRITAVSTKSRLKTVEETIAENFHLILGSFTIRVNGSRVKPPVRAYDYAFPAPDLPADQLVKHIYKPLGDEGPSYDHFIIHNSS